MNDQRGDLPFRPIIGPQLLFAIALGSILFWSRAVVAQPDTSVPAPHTYAVIVGSNPGGEGQDTLKFAEQDAARVAGLRGELGRYPSENVVACGPG